MTSISRRNFVNLSIAGAAISHLAPSMLVETTQPFNEFDIGIYATLDTKNVENTFKHISDLGFRNCEIYTGSYSMELAKPLQDAITKFNMKVLALFTLGPGPTTWDFYEGQKNIGLVSREYRDVRINALNQLSDLAKACGIGMVETHVGYIPENPNDPNYIETVEALKKVISHCSGNGQVFLYHAGQETPTTMVRTILDVGYENQGIGMDTANLIMYDRGHPFNALDIYGKYVKLVNAKDGLYPTDARKLGKEVQIGQGKVDFPSFIKKLKAIGYKGPVIIERESSKSADEWDNDVRQSREFLEVLLNA